MKETARLIESKSVICRKSERKSRADSDRKKNGESNSKSESIRDRKSEKISN